MDNISIIRAVYDSAKKDCTSIVFSRVGIFYITVFDDAKLVGGILGLTVKTRERDGCNMKYLSFDKDGPFGIVRNSNPHSIIPCAITETEEFDF